MRIIICTAIVAIAVMQMYALSQGIDGVLLTTTIAIVAGLGGWVIPTPKVGGKNGRRTTRKS